MDAMRGASPSKGPANPDPSSPEHLLNAFKAAALSVTKLYKTSAAAQNKARSDGYQECLDDLLAFLDRQNIGVSDGEGWQIRRWATERLDGRDAVAQNTESEDEVDKAETTTTNTNTTSSPEIHHRPGISRHDVHSHMRTDSASPTVHATAAANPIITSEPQPIVVPSQENFTFQSPHPYPQESSYLNIDKLDLSDSTRPSETASAASHTSSSAATITHTSRSRNGKRAQRPRPSGHLGSLGKGAGQKRSINLAELFDVGSIGIGKDMFGRDGKRSRHT